VRRFHVAAVFVNNFTNHLYTIGNEICEENQVPFDILKPLILETANKIMTISPNEGQTGPAKRNDRTTIEAHQLFLSDKTNQLFIKSLHNLYKIMAKVIKN
jgi:hypothetical protein